MINNLFALFSVCFASFATYLIASSYFKISEKERNLIQIMDELLYDKSLVEVNIPEDSKFITFKKENVIYRVTIDDLIVAKLKRDAYILEHRITEKTEETEESFKLYNFLSPRN